jgi:hypothetical protein
MMPMFVVVMVFVMLMFFMMVMLMVNRLGENTVLFDMYIMLMMAMAMSMVMSPTIAHSF